MFSIFEYDHSHWLTWVSVKDEGTEIIFIKSLSEVTAFICVINSYDALLWCHYLFIDIYADFLMTVLVIGIWVNFG